LDETYIENFLNEFLQSLFFKYWKRVYKANWRLSTLFQVDLEVIRTMRSEDFNFGFTENISEFMILKRDIRKIRSLYKLCELGLNI